MRLLAAVDLTESHDATFREAVRWAERLGGKVDLAFVETPLVVIPFATDPVMAAALSAESQQHTQGLRDRLDLEIATLPEAIRGNAIYRKGQPVEELLGLSPGYDAVLIGTHGRKGLNKFWLGSVAEQVVRRATVPVLVVRLTPSAP